MLRPPNPVQFEPLKPLKHLWYLSMSVWVVGVAALNMDLFLSEISRHSMLREVVKRSISNKGHVSAAYPRADECFYFLKIWTPDSPFSLGFSHFLAVNLWNTERFVCFKLNSGMIYLKKIWCCVSSQGAHGRAVPYEPGARRPELEPWLTRYVTLDGLSNLSAPYVSICKMRLMIGCLNICGLWLCLAQLLIAFPFCSPNYLYLDNKLYDCPTNNQTYIRRWF